MAAIRCLEHSNTRFSIHTNKETFVRGSAKSNSTPRAPRRHHRPHLSRAPAITAASSLPSPPPPPTTPPVPPPSSSLAKHSWQWRGYNTKYATAGCSSNPNDGKTIVLVHGFGASAGHWRKNIPWFVEKGYKVYALDLLGFGDSEKPIIDYSMELWEAQIVDFIKEFIGGDDTTGPPLTIAGNSVGSLASLMVASRIPNRINGVILFNCAGGMNNKAISDDWRIKLAMPLFLLIDWILKQPALARRLFDNVRATENLKKVLESVYPRHPDAVDDDLVAMLHQPSNDPGALETFVSCITGPPGPRPEQLIPRVQAPVLLLWGDADPFTPSDGPVGKWFQNLAVSTGKNVKFVHLDGVGHCPMDEAPEDCHAALAPWLDSLSSSSSA